MNYFIQKACLLSLDFLDEVMLKTNSWNVSAYEQTNVYQTWVMSLGMEGWEDQEQKYFFVPETERRYFKIFQWNPQIRAYSVENSILYLKIISTNSMLNQTYNPL